ncbi:MAG: hypothetical protein R3B82_05960 [Sandaracinaceae bacterium]
MTLSIDLALERPHVVAGEDLGFRVTLKNDGGADETVRDPALDGEWPKVEVLEPSGYRVAYAGREDRQRGHGHDFMPPPFPETVTLPPGGEASSDERLLHWIGALGPGTYAVRAQLEADGHALRSSTVPLEVAPLDARRVQLLGTDAAPGDMTYALVTNAEPDGSLALLSWLHQLDFEGHLTAAAMQRLGPVGPGATGSVSRAGLPYPGQWVAWVEGDQLRGFYQMQGRVVAPLSGVLSSPAEIIGPVLTELEGCDGSAPPRAEVLMFAPGRAFVACIAPDGSVTEGASWSLDGTLEWGEATLPASNVREAFVALARGGDTDAPALEVVRLRWDADQTPEPPRSIAKRPPGRVIGGDAILGPEGPHGTLVIRRMPDVTAPDLGGPVVDDYELLLFGVDASGTPEAATLRLDVDPPRDFVQILVALRPERGAHLLMQAVGGAWLSSDGSGAKPLTLDGDPLALRFWGGQPRVLLATDRGPAWRPIAP